MFDNYLERSLSYTEYIKLLDDLLLDGNTAGPNQLDVILGYAKLNLQRIHRLEETIALAEAVKIAAKNAMRSVIWLVITEGWCGDAAQNIPIIEKIAAQSVKIETRYILRDENLGLIDQFLTNGARSIPKVIALDAATHEAIGSWGARPQPAQELFHDLKKKGIEKPLIMEDLQRWYNADHGKTLQAEFVKFIEQGEMRTGFGARSLSDLDSWLTACR
ncbi:MAG: thioredoxin family protein [Acidobacteriota bacterium]